jgi:phosphoglycolate phosphatase
MKEFQVQTQAPKSNGFHWMGADAYLFDIDGTLLVSRDGVHRNALHLAMREAYGVDTTIDGIAYHGKTDLGILRAALERAGVSSDRFEANLPAALEVVCRDVSANANRIAPTVCPAIPEVLAELKAAGKMLGLASGNLESVGWLKIEAVGLRDFFSFGCFSDHNESRAGSFAKVSKKCIAGWVSPRRFISSVTPPKMSRRLVSPILRSSQFARVFSEPTN